MAAMPACLAAAAGQGRDAWATALTLALLQLRHADHTDESALLAAKVGLKNGNYGFVCKGLSNFLGLLLSFSRLLSPSLSLSRSPSLCLSRSLSLCLSSYLLFFLSVSFCLCLFLLISHFALASLSH